MDTTILEKVGLTRNEITVYLTLLKCGSIPTQKIIKESGLHRSRIYESLGRLEQMGLVSSVVKDFRRYFHGAKPEMLLNFVEEKKESLRQLLPDLQSLQGTENEELDGSAYKGKEGIKTILAMVLKEKKDLYVLGAKGLIFSELKYFMPNFERERIKAKIKFIRIYDSKEHQKMALKAELVESKSFPPGLASEAVIWIFGSKVVILHWKNKIHSAFVIDKKEVADAFRKWFLLIYKFII